MDTKIKNIITSLVLLAAFFMPWVKVFGFGGSAFDLIMQVFKKIEYAKKEPAGLLILLLLLFPICAFVVLINYAKNEIKPTQLGVIQFAKKTPLILIIATIVFVAIKFSKDLKYIKGNDITQLLSIGLILTLITSIILFFDKTKPISNSKPDNGANQPKEEINTDDIFK